MLYFSTYLLFSPLLYRTTYTYVWYSKIQRARYANGNLYLIFRSVRLLSSTWDVSRFAPYPPFPSAAFIHVRMPEEILSRSLVSLLSINARRWRRRRPSPLRPCVRVARITSRQSSASAHACLSVVRFPSVCASTCEISGNVTASTTRRNDTVLRRTTPEMEVSLPGARSGEFSVCSYRAYIVDFVSILSARPCGSPSALARSLPTPVCF